jgi:type 1 fimbriae regulatory protein FimB/type 1 fimbriae regulatory protein FimE
MAKPQLKLIAPATELGAVHSTPPRKRPYDATRRKYLTPGEVDRLIKAASSNRNPLRDGLMIFMAYRHGLRTAELIRLKWSDVHFDRGELAVSRVKNGTPSTHFLGGDELRKLRRLEREQSPASAFIFVSERGTPFSGRGFRQLVERLGVAADLGHPVNAHALRHACGFKLANDGHDTRSLQAYLGHKNIQHTVRYTELSPHRFRDFWKD